MTPQGPPESASVGPPPTSIALVSVNISSWTHRWQHILAAAEDRKCMIMCVQETG